MTDISISTASTEVLEHEATTLAGQIAAATCRFLLVVAELDQREAWGQWWGCKSMAHWLAWRCSLSTITAREYVRVANALSSLPAITGMFGRGELSYSKVRALVRVATPDSDDDLADLAQTATAAQLEKIIRATAVAMSDPARQADLRNFYSGSDNDEMGVVRARVLIDELAVIDTAIAKALPDKDDSAESSIGQRRASALVRICESYLANGDGARHPAARNNAVVHVTVDPHGVVDAETDAGVPVHPETARRLMCDAQVEGMLGELGVPISTGRANRTVNRKQRRAALKRDGHRCVIDGCPERTYLQIHHVWHWTDGGPTDLDNLVTLCWHHHHLLHEGGWTLTFTNADARLFRPDGTERIVPRPVTDLPALDTTVDDDAIVPRWDGDPMDLAACVDATLTMIRRSP